MKNILIVLLVQISIISFSQTNKTYEDLKLEKRNIENQINLLNSQLKTINSKMLQMKNANNNVVIVGAGNNEIKTTAGSGGAILRNKPSSTGSILSTIKAGDIVILRKEKTGLYLKCSYNGKLGWVSYTSLNSTTELDNFMTAGNKTNAVKKTSTTTVSSVDTNSDKYKRLAKLYGHDRAVKILNKQLWEGMSHGMVVESLGQPSERKSVNTPQGLKEEWIYSDRTVTFFNGSLKSWTNK